MSFLLVFLALCSLFFSKTTPLALNKPWKFESSNCETAVEYQGHKLTVAIDCEIESSLLDPSAFTFFLYFASDDQCQWNQIYRQASDDYRENSRRRVAVEFEHVYSGNYCVAIYEGKWTSTLPIYNSEAPFSLQSNMTEPDVLQLWTPKFNIQPYDSGISIRVETDPANDAYGFETFAIDLYRFDEDVGACNELPVDLKPQYQAEMSGKILFMSNLTQGYYCITINPTDPRCQLTHSSTSMPCMRSSRTTYLSEDEDWTSTVAVILILVMLSIAGSLAAILRRMRKGLKPEPVINTIKDRKILLLHSNEERFNTSIQWLKENLAKKLPSYKIEDYADDAETMATQGVKWFLPRLHETKNFIIVAEPDDILCEEEQSQIFFQFGLQQLEYRASLPDYDHVLIARFRKDDSRDTTISPFIGMFNTYILPSEIGLLIQQLQNC